VFADFHCVTRWSRLGNLWEGVLTPELRRIADPSPDATHVLLHAYDNDWFTNVPIEEFFAEDALIADVHDGMPIALEHGGPVRAIIPRLYGWKSAKWLKSIEFVSADQPGYWEAGGYHMRGDPWREERFRNVNE
jgi:DMSO/TMAO reductase YedYZ molybdopterin-dependent catalytic subunit